MNKILLSISLMCIILTSKAADSIEGFWLTEDGNSIVEVYRTDADVLQGRLVWIDESKNKKDAPIVDKNNPDKSLRSRPLVGIDMLNDLVPENDKWRGKLYAPKRGKTLDAEIGLVDDNQMKITVTFRGFSKDQFWTRTDWSK